MPPAAPNAALSNFAVTYTSPFGYVADDACPLIGVPRSAFEYYKGNLGLATLNVETLVSPTGAANEVQDAGSWQADKVINEALKIGVPQQRIDDYAGLGYNPREGGVARVKDYMQRAREVRLATLMFTAGNYGANTGSPSTAKWDQSTSNPILDITNAQAACWPTANTVLFGLDAWAVFASNAKVIAALYGARGPTVVSLADIKTHLAGYGITEVIIARGRKNASKKGQAASLSAIWTDDVAVYFKNPERSPDGTTFCASFGVELGGPNVPYRVDNWFDKDIGTRGGEWIKTAREIVEAIVEAAAGYLIVDVKT